MDGMGFEGSIAKQGENEAIKGGDMGEVVPVTRQQQCQATQKKRTSKRVRSEVGTKSLLSLVQKQEYRCAMTGRLLTPATAEMDHRTPYARGGKHCIENIAVLDKEVNRAKGTMTDYEFIQMCSEVARKRGHELQD